MSGTIYGVGGLVKGGPGNLVLSSLASYSGFTSVNGGTLTLSNSGALAQTGAISVSNVGTLTTNPSTYSTTAVPGQFAAITPSATGINAVQTLTFGPGITGGNFTLTFNGLTTAPITWNATPATLQASIQTALNALPNIGVNGALLNALVAGTGPFTVTFQNGLGGTSVPTMTFNGAGLVGGTIASLVTTTGGVTATTTTTGGTLALDNTAANNDNRLTYANLLLSGGTLNVIGNSGSASVAVVTNITLGVGNSTIQTTAGTGGTVTLPAPAS